jgi:hypothetical protein
MDHDQRLKALLREFLAEFVALVLAAWQGRFDFAGAEWLQQEVFPDPPRGRRRIIDLLARLKVLRPVGEADQTLIHIEVESGDSVADLRARMPEYRAFLRHRHALPVLSLALYLGVGLEGVGWDEQAERYWEEELGRTRWAYLGLPALDARAYVEGGNLLGVALAVLMRIPPDEKAWLKARAMQRVAEAQLSEFRRYLLMECIEAYLPLEGPHLAEFERLLTTEEFKMALKIGKTSFETGMEQGQERGQRALLRRQLEKRFGPLSETVRQRLEAWPADKLPELGETLLTAKSLAELGLEGDPAAPGGNGAPAVP